MARELSARTPITAASSSRIMQSIDVSKYHPALLRSVVLDSGAREGALAIAALVAWTGPDLPLQGTDRTRRDARRQGYSGDERLFRTLVAWHQRRVIPIGSYVIATEELPTDAVDGPSVPNGQGAL
jgi:hypothetical protein